VKFLFSYWYESFGCWISTRTIFSLIGSIAVIASPLAAVCEASPPPLFTCKVSKDSSELTAEWQDAALSYVASYPLYSPSRIVIDFHSKASEITSVALPNIFGSESCSVSMALSQQQVSLTLSLPSGKEPCLQPNISSTDGRTVLSCALTERESTDSRVVERSSLIEHGNRLKRTLASAEAEINKEFNKPKSIRSLASNASQTSLTLALLFLLLVIILGQWFWIRSMRIGQLRTTEISRRDGFQIGKRLAQHLSEHPLDQGAETMTIQAAYRVLGAKPEWDDEQLRNRYETVLRHNHLERLQSQGASVEEIQVAKDRLYHTNQAYHRIRIFRSR
jgi:hypothetical protein